ncbi:MAG: DUF4230 domain-containing protein [Lachnospiraceae bacterium]|jgi:hypothetical protein|nr:DUF4230 domain-containing protein [Lachnospiraceae bacterium]
MEERYEIHMGREGIRRYFIRISPFMLCIIFFIILIVTVRRNIILNHKLDEIENKKIEIDTVKEEMKQISKYCSYEFYYTSIMHFSDKNQFMGIDIPLTQNSFIATIDGKMNIGIDGEKVEFSAKKSADRKVTVVNIVVPHSEILDNYTISETLKIYDQKNNIFNPLKPEEFNSLREAAEKQKEKEVLNGDILKKSDESMRYLLRSHFRATYGKQVKINYQYREEEKEYDKRKQ